MRHYLLAFAWAVSVAAHAQYYSSVSTYAGTGQSGLLNGSLTNAEFNKPYSLCYDRSTGAIYVADTYNNAIRKILNGQVTTVAGNGIQGDMVGAGANAEFYLPSGVDFKNGYIYVCDNGNHKIKRIDAITGFVETIAGSGSAGSSDGSALSARFFNPAEVRVASDGAVFVSDYGNNTIRRIADGNVTTFAGLAGAAGDALGTGSSARFNRPTGIAFDNMGNLYVADQVNCKIKKIDPNGTVTLLAGSGAEASLDGTGAAAAFMRPTYLAWDPMGALVTSEWMGNRIRQVTIAGVVTTVAGNGEAGLVNGNVQDAEFYSPYGLCVDSLGNAYVGDKMNNVIRKLTKHSASTGVEDIASVPVVELWPNPVRDELFVKVPFPLTRTSEVELVDATGRLAEAHITFQNEGLILDARPLAAGTWMLRIWDNGRVLVGRFVRAAD